MTEKSISHIIVQERKELCAAYFVPKDWYNEKGSAEATKAPFKSHTL